MLPTVTVGVCPPQLVNRLWPGFGRQKTPSNPGADHQAAGLLGVFWLQENRAEIVTPRLRHQAPIVALGEVWGDAPFNLPIGNEAVSDSLMQGGTGNGS